MASLGAGGGVNLEHPPRRRLAGDGTSGWCTGGRGLLRASGKGWSLRVAAEFEGKWGTTITALGSSPTEGEEKELRPWGLHFYRRAVRRLRGGVGQRRRPTGQPACAWRRWHSQSLDAWRCRLARTPRHVPGRGSVACGLCRASHRRTGLPWRNRGHTPKGWTRDAWLTWTGSWRVPVW
jgi:hypothetical protein